MQTKRIRRLSPATDFFIGLPDHIIIFILVKLAASADSPSDLISIAMTCSRFSVLVLDPYVLSNASQRSLAVRAKTWCESTERFLTRCADAGNLEACYILGMIRFYCLKGCRNSGAMLIKKAAMGSHLDAVYSLAVIYFNSSGMAARSERDISTGLKLALFAALRGHTISLREIEYCLFEGYGVKQDIDRGWHLIIKAKTREIVEVLGPSASLSSVWWINLVLKQHPANRFMSEWFQAEEGVRLCSNNRCGRPETRRNEFRQCSMCLKARYCTNTCWYASTCRRRSPSSGCMLPPAAAAAAPPPAEGGA